MRFSIITTCLNAKKTIRFTLNSVLAQSYQNIEHVIVDGGSTDGTKKIIKKYHHPHKKIYTLKKSTIYEAINFGIKKSTGDIICVLNADDIYNSNTIIKSVAKIIKKKKKYDMYFGNVIFFKNKNFISPTRFYEVKNYKREMILQSLMPPHPSSFIRRQVYENFCIYDEKLKIASDYDFFLQTLIKFQLKFYIINKTIVRMKTGVASTKNALSYFYNSFEILKSFKKNNLKIPYISIISRFFDKLTQMAFLDVKKINKGYCFPEISFDKKILQSQEIKIIKNIKNIINKNFVISAMNLAFLGSYSKKNVSLYKDLYHWPDGVFAYRNFGIKKIPGRVFFSKIKLSIAIKKITVFGNLSDRSHNYLLKKFSLPVEHIKLPYGNSKIIHGSIKKNISKNTLVLITLPTPKQEMLAEFLVKKNKFFKIICIGASIAMLSGDEAAVPKFLYKFEFIWRLRFETKRRIWRLLSTFYNYLLGKFFYKSFVDFYITGSNEK